MTIRHERHWETDVGGVHNCDPPAVFVAIGIPTAESLLHLSRQRLPVDSICLCLLRKSAGRADPANERHLCGQRLRPPGQALVVIHRYLSFWQSYSTNRRFNNALLGVFASGGEAGKNSHPVASALQSGINVLDFPSCNSNPGRSSSHGACDPGEQRHLLLGDGGNYQRHHRPRSEERRVGKECLE